jgi:hypothetical protein
MMLMALIFTKKKMKQFLVLATLLLSQGVFAQVADQQLLGKWQIVIFNAGIYHHYKKDSTAISPAVQQYLKAQNDSAMAIDMLKLMIDALKGFTYVFSPNGTYQELKETKVKATGKYQTIPSKQKLVLRRTSKAKTKSSEYLTYSIDNNVLTLKTAEDGKPIIFQFEKINN